MLYGNYWIKIYEPIRSMNLILSFLSGYVVGTIVVGLVVFNIVIKDK